MRIRAGKAKGRKVKALNTLSTRPTLGRVKASLFDMLGTNVVGAKWLDLYSGTGNIGMEALSRGAAEVIFVEKDARQIRLIKENLLNLDLISGSKVYKGDVTDAICFLERQGLKFNLVYLAPPFLKGLCLPTVTTLSLSAILEEDARIGVEHHKKEELPQRIGDLLLIKTRRYGDIVVSFYNKVIDDEI